MSYWIVSNSGMYFHVAGELNIYALNDCFVCHESALAFAHYMEVFGNNGMDLDEFESSVINIDLAAETYSYLHFPAESYIAEYGSVEKFIDKFVV